MFNATITAIRTLLCLSLLTGFLYPLLIFGIGKAFFLEQTNGSLIFKNGQLIGSELIAQEFNSELYFHSRPSAVQHNTLPSGASNLGPTSSTLKELVSERRSRYGNDAPPDLLSASGSGLDPHLSPEATLYQLDRVAAARNLTEDQKQKLKSKINELTEPPQFGLLGRNRVNILRLNLALDEMQK